MSDFQRILNLESEKQWEITKGHLRTSVCIVGQVYGMPPINMQTEEPKYNKFKRLVEDFIKTAENEELYIPEESKLR